MNEILSCYKLNNQLIGKLSRIEDTRTNTENELEFHISFRIREFIDSQKIYLNF